MITPNNLPEEAAQIDQLVSTEVANCYEIGNTRVNHYTIGNTRVKHYTLGNTRVNLYIY